MSSRIRVPYLAEVRRVPDERLYEYPHADDLLIAMNRAGIGCFADEAGNYWFGSSAPEIPEHVRWLYTLSLEARMDRGYNSSRFRVLRLCGSDTLAVPPPLTDLIDELLDLASQQAQTLRRIDAQDPEEQQRLARNFLTASREFGLRSPIHMVPFTRAPWNQELHDILRHWDEWSALNNPENMPQDLVLRLHGLASYAEELRTNTQYW
jgi:hypothetical protein